MTPRQIEPIPEVPGQLQRRGQARSCNCADCALGGPGLPRKSAGVATDAMWHSVTTRWSDRRASTEWRRGAWYWRPSRAITAPLFLAEAGGQSTT
jgi:hypothetical protein